MCFWFFQRTDTMCKLWAPTNFSNDVDHRQQQFRFLLGRTVLFADGAAHKIPMVLRYSQGQFLPAPISGTCTVSWMGLLRTGFASRSLPSATVHGAVPVCYALPTPYSKSPAGVQVRAGRTFDYRR